MKLVIHSQTSTVASPFHPVLYNGCYVFPPFRRASTFKSSASLAFVWGIHPDRWIPRTKGQLRGKCFHLMTSSWSIVHTSYKTIGVEVITHRWSSRGFDNNIVSDYKEGCYNENRFADVTKLIDRKNVVSLNVSLREHERSRTHVRACVCVCRYLLCHAQTCVGLCYMAMLV